MPHATSCKAGCGDRPAGMGQTLRQLPHPSCLTAKTPSRRPEPQALRSHYDGIRSLAFHHSQSALLTASEDGTLKLWNLQKAVTAKKWRAAAPGWRAGWGSGHGGAG